MATLKDRLSLDWLRQAQQTGTSRSAGELTSGFTGLEDPMEEALITFGGEILRTYRDENGEDLRLYDVAKKLDLRIEEILPVADHLIRRGYLRKVVDDQLGNHLLRLTDRGRQAAR